MVALYVDGVKVGTLAEYTPLLTCLLADNRRVELRIEAVVDSRPLEFDDTPYDPGRPIPWDPTITRADIERMLTEPGYTFEEVERMLGWVA